MKENVYSQNCMAFLKSTSFVLVMLLCGNLLFAQNGAATINGKVTDAETSLGLSGVSIVVKGKTTGVFTDQNGNFSISADPSTKLIFSFIGYTPSEVTVGSQTLINIKLQPASGELKDVVVTALNIRREKRSLGYSVTTVSGNTLTEARETNFVNGLEGKVAGVNVSNVATGPEVRRML